MRHQNFNVPFLPNGTWWMTFYWFTNRLLAPYERCDCYKVSQKMSEFCENRYYRDFQNNVFLTYIEAYGHSSSIHGRWNASQVSSTLVSSSSLSSPHNDAADANNTTTEDWSLEKLPFAWSYKNWDDLIRHHVAKLQPKPNYAVLNAGIWEHKFYRNAAARQALAAALRETGIIGIWKTTTYRNDTLPGRTRWTNHSDADPLMCQVLPGCLNVSWTKFLDTTLWWDHHHMYEPVYRRMNEQLLEYIQHLLPSSSWR